MALLYAIEHLQTDGSWDYNPFSFQEQSMDNREIILSLPVRFKCVWYSGTIWPTFVAVLPQCLTNFVFLFFSDSLKLCVGGRKGGRYMLDNRSPLQYSTDRPARLQGLWITCQRWSVRNRISTGACEGVVSVATSLLGSFIQGLGPEACGLFRCGTVFR